MDPYIKRIPALEKKDDVGMFAQFAPEVSSPVSSMCLILTGPSDLSLEDHKVIWKNQACTNSHIDPVITRSTSFNQVSYMDRLGG